MISVSVTLEIEYLFIYNVLCTILCEDRLTSTRGAFLAESEVIQTL